jgi:hypothetical protein
VRKRLFDRDAVEGSELTPTPDGTGQIGSFPAQNAGSAGFQIRWSQKAVHLLQFWSEYF